MFSDILFDLFLSGSTAVCWSVLFGTPARVLWMAGLLGGVGHSLRFVLMQAGVGIIPGTLAASLLIGLLGIYCAHKVHNPPVVFTMPACITMIPGLYAYRSILGAIRLSDASTVSTNPYILQDIAHNVILTLSLLFALAVGISVSALLFPNKKSVKEIWTTRFGAMEEQN